MKETTDTSSAELLDSLKFCVIDLETTGFSPRLGDRVVEIAAVRMRGDGTGSGSARSTQEDQSDAHHHAGLQRNCGAVLFRRQRQPAARLFG